MNEKMCTEYKGRVTKSIRKVIEDAMPPDFKKEYVDASPSRKPKIVKILTENECLPPEKQLKLGLEMVENLWHTWYLGWTAFTKSGEKVNVTTKDIEGYIYWTKQNKQIPYGNPLRND